MAVKDDDIFTHSPDPCSLLRIKCALRWLCENKHLYCSFLSHYDPFVKPSFINTNLLEKLLESEAAGMTFPLDANIMMTSP